MPNACLNRFQSCLTRQQLGGPILDLRLNTDERPPPGQSGHVSRRAPEQPGEEKMVASAAGIACTPFFLGVQSAFLVI